MWGSRFEAAPDPGRYVKVHGYRQHALVPSRRGAIELKGELTLDAWAEVIWAAVKESWTSVIARR